MYGYSVSQILTGLGAFGFGVGSGVVTFLKIVIPFTRMGRNGNNNYVQRHECIARHDAEIQRHKEVRVELSKLFSKSDQTERGVAKIMGMLEGMQS